MSLSLRQDRQRKKSALLSKNTTDIQEPDSIIGLGRARSKPKAQTVGMPSAKGEMQKVKNTYADTSKQVASWGQGWDEILDEVFQEDAPELAEAKKNLGVSNSKTSKSVDLSSESNMGKLADLIASHETFKDSPYKDYKQLSIGYGSKATSKNQTVTEEQARAMLEEDVSKAYNAVLRAEKKYNYDFTENNRLALAMFTHNLGSGEGTSDEKPKGLKQLLDNGNRGIEAISDAIPLYNKAGGKVAKGLDRRRADELEIFNYGFKGFNQ
tara:strand:+ start:658 stop:1461 length:804 start_codon:yes stop_codon:yes gene_type:complete